MDRREAVAALIQRPRPGIFAAAAVMLLAMAGLWITSFAIGFIALSDGAGRDFLLDAMFYLPFVVLPIALYARRHPGLSDAMRLNPAPLGTMLRVISLAILSMFAASGLNSLWGTLLNAIGLHEPDVTLEIGSSSALSLAVLHAAAIPAVCEELLCRGFVFSAFESKGTGCAIAVSSVMFALMHGNVFGLPAYLLVGGISAYLVYALDSLYAGIIYHTTYNAAILIAVYLLPRPEGAPAAAVPPAQWASVAVVNLALVGLCISITLKTLELRRRALGIEPIPRIPQPLRSGERAMLIALAAAYIGTCALVLMGV